ncbi:hypothetical protein ACLOJK_030143 [Asimina triloba]
MEDRKAASSSSAATSPFCPSSMSVDPFGGKDSSTSENISSSGIFSSVFAPESKLIRLCDEFTGFQTQSVVYRVMVVKDLWMNRAAKCLDEPVLIRWIVGKDSSQFDSLIPWKKQAPEPKVLNAEHKSSDSIEEGCENENKNVLDMDKISVNPTETVVPCIFGSSLHYGGRDIFSHSSTEALVTPAIFKKADGNEDPNANNDNSASRGNWWQDLADVKPQHRAARASAPRIAGNKQLCVPFSALHVAFPLWVIKPT